MFYFFLETEANVKSSIYDLETEAKVKSSIYDLKKGVTSFLDSAKRYF